MKRKMGKSNFKSNFYIGKMGLGTKGNAMWEGRNAAHYMIRSTP